MLGREVLKRGMLLPAWLAIRQGDRTEVGTGAVGVCAAPEGAPHARFDPIDLLVPGFIESLGSRHLIRLGGRRSGFGFRTAWGSSTAGLSALTAGVPRSWRGRRGRICRRCTRVRDMSCTLEGRATERAVRRDSEGKRQKLVVEPFDHEQVHFV